MKRKKGYLLLESAISIASIVIIISLLYYILIFSNNIKMKIEDSVELQQQGNEVSKYIKEAIQNSKYIINYDKNSELKSVTSIKCKYKENDNKLKDKEIFLNKNSNKIFIRTLDVYGNSEGGGYEVGDYIDNMYISTDYDGKIANIKLELSKNNTNLEKEFTVNIINFEGDNKWEL